MNRLQRVAVALSGTDADRPLLTYARLLASMGVAKQYHFVHVRTPAHKADDPETDAAVLARCEALVGELFVTATTDVLYRCHVLEGVRVDTLIAFIARQQCDLALLGHRRERSGQRSLARRLAMIAPCSVWLVPEGAPLSIRNILVPIDFSDHAADSLTVATSLAKAAGRSDCLAAHIFADPSFIRYDERRDELLRDHQETFAEFLRPIDRHGIHVDAAFVEGNNVARTLLYTAQRHSSDLIVMNTRGRSRAAAILLGSVTSQVLTDSPIPVLAVKHAGAMLSLFQVLHEGKLWNTSSPKTN